MRISARERHSIQRVEVFRRNPFFLPLLAALFGMSLEVALPGEPRSYWPALLLIPLLAWARFRSPRRLSSHWVIGVTAFFLGGFWLSLHPLPEAPPANAEPGERVIVAGCVDSAVTRTPQRAQFALRTPDGARLQVGVYPRREEALPVIRYGQQVEVEGRLRAPRNFRNPGAFDYERYLARKNVFWLISATGTNSLRTGQIACGASLPGVAHHFRERLLDRLAARFHAQPEAQAWLSAILLGDDSMLSEETLESYRLAGVYHVLVISGQHVAILAAAFLLLFRLLSLPRAAACLLTASLCWVYALIAGSEVPALRAAMAVTLYLGASLVFRRTRPLNLLALIALLFLAWDPGQLLDASFQLSFLAVLAIGGIAIPIERALFGNWRAAATSLNDPAADLRVPPKIAEARVELRLLARSLHCVFRLPQRVLL
ncbi:MAG: ComEC family competence protein [Bryobacterales bacterium]|nr:ComEC family competence protein [Bryobacterales bacterium]